MWIDVHTVPLWPLPSKDLHTELYSKCLEHRLDPDTCVCEQSLGRDERRYFES